jgi:hypothetical protein
VAHQLRPGVTRDRLTRCVNRKEPEVDYKVPRRHVRLGVVLVQVVVELALRVEDGRDVVCVSSVVENVVTVDGEVRRVPGVVPVPADDPGSSVA